MTDKIIGLKQTVNNEYQKNVHATTRNILGTSESIGINELKSNSVFTELLSNTDSNIATKLFDKIRELAGSNINKDELKTILILMDANLELVNDQEKFVMDEKFEITSKSGIFQATKDEIISILKSIRLFDYDNKDIKMFPTMLEDGTIIAYDKDGNEVQRVKQ